MSCNENIVIVQEAHHADPCHELHQSRMHDCIQRGALHGIPRDVGKGQRANYTVDGYVVPIRCIRPYRHVRGHVIPFEPSIAGVAVEALNQMIAETGHWYRTMV